MRARGVKTIRKTIHLSEENDHLTLDVKWPDGTHNLQSIEYGKVNFVKSSKEGKHQSVDIEFDDSSLGVLVPVPTEDDAHALAEYVARQSPLRLDLIGDAWRVRKPFLCLEPIGIGCRDYKELLEADDADIVDSFYSRDEYSRHYACFSGSSRRFFTVSHGLPREYVKSGFFIQNIFINGQSNSTYFVPIEWSQYSDNYATMVTLTPKGGKQQVGYISQSELTYHTEFENINQTKTQYSLSIRWSTGRYIEQFSGKDEKGKPWNNDDSGLCVKLN